MFAEVLIEYSAKSIDKTFTYKVPEHLQSVIKVGMKVLVPFGPKTINGFITNIVNDYNDEYEIKEIEDIVDKYFCLNKELMELGTYLQHKTLCTKIAAYQTMLPSSLKVKTQEHNYSKYIYYVELNKNYLEIDTYIKENPRRKKQIEVLEDLLKKNKMLKSTYTSNIINALLEEDLIKITKEQIYRLDAEHEIINDIKLNKMQQTAVDSIKFKEKNT